MPLLQRHTVLTAFKVLVFALMVMVIVRALFIQEGFTTQSAYFIEQLRTAPMWLLLAAIALVPVNWGLETVKWKQLLGQGTLRELAKGILAGVTLGLVTPGRSGEFAGRVFFINEGQRAGAFYLSAMGGMAQTAVTLAAGVVGLAWWGSAPFVYGMAVGVAAIFLLLYFRFDWMSRLALSVPFLSNRGLVIHGHQLPPLRVRWQVLLLSLARYGVYLLQYVLVFGFFGVHPAWAVLAAGCSVLLLVQSFSPFMPLVDVGYRGGAALYVFQGIAHNNLSIITAVLLLWGINLLLPALAGYMFVLKKK